MPRWLVAPAGWDGICSRGDATITHAAAAYNNTDGFTVFTWLLPYVEQQALYDESQRQINIQIQGKWFREYSLAVYKCPTDHTIARNGYCKTTHDSANTWAASSYAANYLVAPEEFVSCLCFWGLRVVLWR